MKRKIDENGETEVTPQFQPVQQNFAMRGAQTSWQPWGNNNMRFRGGRNPWRGPRGMPNNNHGYYRTPGRGGPTPYGYFDPNQQLYQQQPGFFHNTKWNQIPPPPPVIPFPPPQPTAVEGQEVPNITIAMAVPDYQNPPQQMMQQPPPNIQQQQQQQQQLQQQHHQQQHQQQQHHQQHQQQQQQRQQQQRQQQQQNQHQPEEGFKKGKNRRRPMSQSYPTRPWNKEDAERALSEEAVHMKGLRNKSLIIRFPDPEVSKDMVKGFHPAIDKVHFQVPSGPRYCFVQLHEKASTEKTIKDLEEISFGSGRLVVEKKFQKEDEDLTPEAIDPYTLYIGNLPTNVNVACVKEKFPTASRIDIGFAQKMKHTRYAFIRYNSVDDAIQAYRDSHNLVLESRSIIVRFRRQRGHLGLPGENGNQKQPPKPAKSKVKKETKDKEKDKDKDKDKEKDEAKEKEKEKTAKKDSSKVKKEGNKEEEDDDDDDEVVNEDEDDDDDDDEEEDDDDDDDDDDEEDDDEDDDDDEDEDEEEDNQDDDDDPDDDGGAEDGDDDDDDEDNDNEDDAEDIFQQIDSQIGDLNGVHFSF